MLTGVSWTRPTLVLGVGLLVSVGVWLVLSSGLERASGTHNSVTITVGLDANPDSSPANTATSLGSIESCRSVSNGSTFTVDFWVKGILSPEIDSFQGDISYDKTRLKVTANNVSMLLGANPGSSVSNLTNTTTDALPDQDGKFTPAAYDWGTAPGHAETGAGVLTKLTFEAVAAGTSALTLTNVLMGDPTLPEPNPIGDINSDGFFDGHIFSADIRIGSQCPTPAPTATPSPSPTPPPDSDGDGIADSVDNCRTVPNTGQQNADGDAFGDACDSCPTTFTGWPTPSGDTDCDGFESARETTIGTLPLVACGVNAWPVDFDSNKMIDISDVLTLKPVFGSTVPPASPRFDISPGGGVDISDVLAIKPFFGASCAP